MDERKAAIYREVLQATFLLRQRVADFEEKHGDKTTTEGTKIAAEYDGMVEQLVQRASIHARLANAVLEEADDYADFVEAYEDASKRGMKMVPRDEADDEEDA